MLLLPIFMPWKYKHHILAPVHSLLIPANAIIIAGGSYLASDAGTDPTDFNEKAKVLRSVGSAIFLAVTLFFNACVTYTLISDSKRGNRKVHPTLIILTMVSALLIVRGVFGLLQSAVWSVSERTSLKRRGERVLTVACLPCLQLSYVNPANYTSHGFTSRFIALEYCLTVVPEFSS